MILRRASAHKRGLRQSHNTNQSLVTQIQLKLLLLARIEIPPALIVKKSLFTVELCCEMLLLFYLKTINIWADLWSGNADGKGQLSVCFHTALPGEDLCGNVTSASPTHVFRSTVRTGDAQLLLWPVPLWRVW